MVPGRSSATFGFTKDFQKESDIHFSNLQMIPNVFNWFGSVKYDSYIEVLHGPKTK